MKAGIPMTRKKDDFVWKLRDEVVEAIESIPNYIRDHPMERKSQVRPLSELESFEVVKGASEGRRIRIYSTKYERKPQNRDAASLWQRKSTAARFAKRADSILKRFTEHSDAILSRFTTISRSLSRTARLALIPRRI